MTMRSQTQTRIVTMTRVVTTSGLLLMPILASAAAPRPAGPATAGPAADTNAVAAWYDNTLVCQDQETKAVCRLWLERDGHYFAFFGLAPQPVAPDIHGPFHVNGREGTYAIRVIDGQTQLCLYAAAPRIRILAEQQQELFAESRCYPVAAHQPGDSWTGNDAAGRSYRFWLLKGR